MTFFPSWHVRVSVSFIFFYSDVYCVEKVLLFIGLFMWIPNKRIKETVSRDLWHIFGFKTKSVLFGLPPMLQKFILHSLILFLTNYLLYSIPLTTCMIIFTDFCQSSCWTFNNYPKSPAWELQNACPKPSGNLCPHLEALGKVI